MPPLTPSRMRAISPSFGAASSASRPGTACRLGLVLVLELARRRLVQGDREVVAAAGLDHRRRVLTVGALGERVVVGVDLTGPLGGDDDSRVVGVRLIQELVDAWLDHLRA